MKHITILVILTLLLTPVAVAASPAPIPQSSMQADIDRAMRYRDKIERVFENSNSSYGIMVYSALSRYEVGHIPVFLVALAAKESGGRKKLYNDNYIGLFQIFGFGPYKRYKIRPTANYWIDNRYYLVPVKVNTKLAILLLDKIVEEEWNGKNHMGSEPLIQVLIRFHCTPNHYSFIVYSCDGGREWAEDFYYNYYPATERVYHK